MYAVYAGTTVHTVHADPVDEWITLWVKSLDAEGLGRENGYLSPKK